MKFYKIAIYAIIFIIIIILVYIFYNYVKNKIDYNVEPFYGQTIQTVDRIPFFDLIETYDYDDMSYFWYKMPYYNDPVEITSGRIIPPDSFFINNNSGPGEMIGGTEFDSANEFQKANGLFGRYLENLNFSDSIDYYGAVIILAKPNIHRINLKNFILSMGNISEFDLSVVELETIKKSYDVLYKINFWYSVKKTSFYDNELIGNKLNKKTTGFEYVQYIYDPVNYNNEISNNLFFKNYTNKYDEFITKRLGDYDYNDMNNRMRLIYDIYNGDLSEMNLNYKKTHYPVEYFILDNVEKPYHSYLESLNIDEDWEADVKLDFKNTFKVNVNSAAGIIMRKVIVDNKTMYDSIFEDTEFTNKLKPGISKTMKDFFNHFFILNALYSLYIDRYYYLDVKYYNPNNEIKTLSYDGSKFTGGETFTTLHADWLTGIGLDKENKGAYEYTSEDGTQFSVSIGRAADRQSLYYYYSNFGVDITSSIGINTAPISKQYRGGTYIQAIDILDGGATRRRIQEDISKENAKIESYRVIVNTAIQKIKDVRKNISVRKYLAACSYDDFTGDNINKQHKINDTVSDNSEFKFESFTTSLYSLLPPGLSRISDYSNRDDQKDRGFGSTSTSSIFKDLDWQNGTFTFTKKGGYNLAKAKIDKDVVTVSPYFDWMGLGTGDATKEITAKPLDFVAKKLFEGISGLGYDVQWYSDAIYYALTNDVAKNIGRNLTDKPYKEKYDANRVSLAEGQVTSYKGQTLTDWRSYWGYYLNNPSAQSDYAKLATSAPTVAPDQLLTNLLKTAITDVEKARKDLVGVEKSREAIVEKIYYGPVNVRYNNLFKEQIPALLKSCAIKLQNTIDEISEFTFSVNTFKNFQEINYKWEQRLYAMSINKIVNVVQNFKSDGSLDNSKILLNKNNETFELLNKKTIRDKTKATVDDFYNLIPITSLMPGMVYFDDTSNNDKKTESNATSLYNDSLNDYTIFIKTDFPSLIENIIGFINFFILKRILNETNSAIGKLIGDYKKVTKSLYKNYRGTFLINVKPVTNKLYQNIKSFIKREKSVGPVSEKEYRYISNSIVKITNIMKTEYVFWDNFSKYINNDKKINTEKVLNFLEDYEKYFSEINTSLIHILDNKKVNFFTIRNNLSKSYKKNKKNENVLEKILNTDPLKTNLTDMFSLENPFNKLNTLKYEFTNIYYSAQLKPNFFRKDGGVLVRDANTYDDIFNHPKILMTQSEIIDDNTIMSSFAIFDIGIILRYIFDYDIVNYVNGKEKYNNYNFPTWFKYDSNNVIDIDSKTDILSDDNFKKLQINSKLNNFFDKVDKNYKLFIDKYENVNYVTYPIVYYNFVIEEEGLYADITKTLGDFVDDKHNVKDFLIYSYTNNFTSSVNCLMTMYNDDLCNIILPLYKQLNDMFDIIIDPVYNFTLSDFTDLKKTIENNSYLTGENFKKGFNKYRKAFEDLNNGNAYQKPMLNSKKTPAPEESKENKNVPGSLNYIFNVHNFLLNLILRAFYYYNKYRNLINKHGFIIANEFKPDFIDMISTAPDKYNLKNEYIVNNCSVSTITAYLTSYHNFINEALLLYKNKVNKCCYNHLILNMANIAYDMENIDHYIYKSGGDNTTVAIQKGEILIKTFKIYENMLNTVKNGELYITSINKTHGLVSEIGNLTEPDGRKKFQELNIDVSERGFWSIKSNTITNEGLDFYNPAFKNISDSINNYLNTVFYFGNAKLYGCFKGNVSNYYSEMGVSKEIKGKELVDGDKPTIISRVNNIDSSGNITKYGAIANCINDTIAHNSLINVEATPGSSNVDSNKKPFDLVTIVPYNDAKNEKNGSKLDVYTCYAGRSSNFNKKKDKNQKSTLKINDMDKCALNYTNNDGTINKVLNDNLVNNTIIYKIDDIKNYESETVVILGCYKKNIPELGVYGTLPNFIGTISGSSFSNPSDIMIACQKLVKQYNDGMGTDYDIFGITTNPADSLALDCYAGSLQIDSKYAKYAKNDAYQENCNIYFPGTDNFIIFQDKENVKNECLTKEVDNLQKYNDKLTAYLNKNITQQQQVVKELGMDINLLNNMFPIKFSVSEISNSKDFASITIDKNASTGFDSNDSILRTCGLKVKVKEGPPGTKGDLGVFGEKGKNTKGSDGDIGEAGYWGKSKKKI